MSKVKTVDVSTSLTPLSKTNGIIREALMLNPGATEWRQRLIKTMELWGCEDDSVSVDRFCRDYGILYNLLLTYVNKYDDVGAAYHEMKRRIGANRWIKAFNKQASESLVMKDLHRYHDEWHEINKYHADMKKIEEKQDGIQVVYIEKVASTGKVPEKKSKAIEVENE